MRQDRYDSHKNEYRKLCETFEEEPKINIESLYDCEVRLDNEIEKLINHQNKKLYKQAKAELEAEGISFKVDKTKREFILNRFKDLLFDLRIFPKKEDYKLVLKFDKRSQINDYIKDLQDKRVEEGVWEYDL